MFTKVASFSVAAATKTGGFMDEKLASEALQSLLAMARPILIKSKYKGMLERARHMNANSEQIGALRKVCLVFAAKLVENPDDHGIEAQLAALLSELYLANFANSGVIAEQLSGMVVEEESFFDIFDSRLFNDERTKKRNAKFSNDLNSLLDRMKDKDNKEQGVAMIKPVNACDAFTSAKNLIDQTKSKLNNNGTRKNLGGKRWAIKEEPNDEVQEVKTEFGYYNLTKTPAARPTPNAPKNPEPKEEAVVVDERLQGIEPRLIEMIKNEIMHRVDSISWDRIAGLEHAKKTIFEIVIWPMLRPYTMLSCMHHNTCL